LSNDSGQDGIASGQDSLVRRSFLPYLSSMQPDIRWNWLRMHCLYQWPEFVRRRDEARRVQLETLANNMRLMNTFRRVVEDLGVPVMPLKGVYLWETLYKGREHLRPAHDVDLMIHPSDVSAAVERMKKANYELILNSARNLGSHFRAYAPTGEKIDFHMRVALNLKTGMESFLPRPGTCLGVECLMPDDGRHTSFLGWHLLKHIFEGGGVRLAWVDEYFRLQERPTDGAPREDGEGSSTDRVERLIELLFHPQSAPGGPRSLIEKRFVRAYSMVDFLPDLFKEQATGVPRGGRTMKRSRMFSALHHFFLQP
jgi:hypothetical protein